VLNTVDLNTIKAVTSEEKSEAKRVDSNDDVPEGVDLNLFHSPRIAKKLGGGVQAASLGSIKHGGRGNATEGVEERPAYTKAKRHPLDPRALEEEVSTTVHFKDTSSSSEDAPTEEVAQLVQDIADTNPSTVVYEMRESKVPSTRLGRLWNYGGLAAGMLGGALSESVRRATGTGGDGSYILSAANMDRLVAKLSRMRGAALKLGQMMSFQDSKMLPPAIQQVLLRVQDSADYMPAYQRDKVLASNLGPEWRELFSSFEEKPMAAASIGQVHSAVLRSTGEKVAVKIQYPGVANSIDSDLSNLSLLLTASRLLPKGLYLDKTIANARTELAWECDYQREAECGQRFREYLSDEADVFKVPKIYAEASGAQVLAMEYMDGVGVTKLKDLTQDEKDWIGTQILRLCLREMTEFRFMQTDPNWTNFLYNTKTKKLELLDFGASRDYPEDFISTYTRLLLAASRTDKETVRELSIKLGYLTGHESKAMLNAHISSVLTLAEPFLESSPKVYDFRDQTITERVKALIPVMIRERLAPPPEETYSLHRKLSGAFLLCAKLGSRVPCRELFEKSVTKAGLS
jgi:aarF domain-containing kinase